MLITNWINKWRLTEQVNDIRVRNGLDSLTRDRSLDKVAWQHARYMAKNDRLGHDGFESRAAIIRWQNKRFIRSSVAENCGKCPGSSLDISVIGATLDGWMKSASHRNAILNPLYNRTGIASFTNKDNIYIVQIFAADGLESSRQHSASGIPAFS
jgi:uncharacterized protein YkwD